MILSLAETAQPLGIALAALDFHHYSHAVVHRNPPSNPVDIEQCEGRVHRYKNHALRKNLGVAYRDTRAMTGKSGPWDAISDAVVADRADGTSDVVPRWVFPGAAKIERLVPMLPMSRDVGRLPELIDGARRYRMVFGQPRQSELLASLAERYPPEGLDDLARRLAVDLSPRPLLGPCPACGSREVATIAYGLIGCKYFLEPLASRRSSAREFSQTPTSEACPDLASSCRTIGRR